MYHIVLVSEDRILLKKIYPFLEDTSRFCIHVVPFSMDAAEAFAHFHADIAILDTEVFTPYESILDEFEKNQWSYSIILLSNGNQSTSFKQNITSVSKDQITKEVMQQKLNFITSVEKKSTDQSISTEINWRGQHNIRLVPGTYHIVFIKTFEQKKSIENCRSQIEQKLNEYSRITPLFFSDNTLCAILNRSELKSDFNFARLSQDIWSITGNTSAILYKSSINYMQMEKECSILKELEDYSYFFSGQCFSFDDIEKSCNFKGEKILHEQCSRLLHGLLAGEPESAIHILRELYLHTIKTGISFRNLEYIRMQLNFFLFIFTARNFSFDYDSAENEMNGILDSLEFKSSFSELNKLPEILSDAIIQIYNTYQTNISLEGIASELGRNKIYLNRVYKEHFKITVLDTLQHLRLEDAKYYLTNTHLKVAEIAELTGFNDIGYFSKFFHHETGVTALEYRTQKGGAKK